jgi:hypothetical protein
MTSFYRRYVPWNLKDPVCPDRDIAWIVKNMPDPSITSCRHWRTRFSMNRVADPCPEKPGKNQLIADGKEETVPKIV